MVPAGYIRDGFVELVLFVGFHVMVVSRKESAILLDTVIHMLVIHASIGRS